MLYLLQQGSCFLPPYTKDYEVVNVANVSLTLQVTLDVLVERIQVDESEQLR